MIDPAFTRSNGDTTNGAASNSACRGAGAFGDLLLEAGIGGLDFGGAFVDAAFQVTVKGAQGFLGADADKFVGEECGEGGNAEFVDQGG